MTETADEFYEGFFRGNIQRRKEEGFTKEAVLQWLCVVSEIAREDLPADDFEPRLARAKAIIEEVYSNSQKVIH